ncbi:PAS domain-containing sensor histidine kinase [Brasilonema sp. UFV-L1]|uniref:PAS domain-containing sensor histidine kinase n=1 Tax=Brasilonema sp. UFV-L1 TaxID=2234130 RepID=UPI00403F4CA9
MTIFQFLHGLATKLNNPLHNLKTRLGLAIEGKKQVKIPQLQAQDEIANFSKYNFAEVRSVIVRNCALALKRNYKPLLRYEFMKCSTKSVDLLISSLTQDLKASHAQLQLEITSKLMAQEMLRQSEEKFRLLAQNIQEVFWLQDFKSSEIIYISPVYEQIWQRSCESLYSNPNSWLEAVHPEDRKRVVTNIQQNIYSSYHHEYRIKQPGGSVRWIWDSSFPVYNNCGEIYRRVRITQDITERKQAEETRLALEKEREINQLKSEFIIIASHEFRTPLTTILLSCDFLKNSSEQLSYEKKERYLNKIKSNVKYLNEILEDVLIVSTSEAGKLKFEPTPIDLSSFCLDLIEQLQMSAGEKYHLNFVEQCDYSSQRKEFLWLDEKLLRHILTNLLSNAIKYSPQGGTIQFQLICDQKSVIFRIQDEGIGIPEKDLPKLFTSFFRSCNTGNIPGTGLGLTIVKNAVELHGGQITVESQLDVGTIFTVILPLNNKFAVEKTIINMKTN